MRFTHTIGIVAAVVGAIMTVTALAAVVRYNADSIDNDEATNA